MIGQKSVRPSCLAVLLCFSSSVAASHLSCFLASTSACWPSHNIWTRGDSRPLCPYTALHRYGEQGPEPFVQQAAHSVKTCTEQGDLMVNDWDTAG